MKWENIRKNNFGIFIYSVLKINMFQTKLNQKINKQQIEYIHKTKGDAYMEYFICCFIGYGLGCVNPAYVISLLKHKDIRNSGTGSLVMQGVIPGAGIGICTGRKYGGDRTYFSFLSSF